MKNKKLYPSYLMLVAELLETQEKLLRQPLEVMVKEQVQERRNFYLQICTENLSERLSFPVVLIQSE